MQAALDDAVAEGRRRRLADPQPPMYYYYFPSLKNLCVNVITKDPQYFIQKSESLSCLPRELHTLVQTKLLVSARVCGVPQKFSQDVVQSLVSWNMQELVFFTGWTDEAATRVLQLAVQTCAIGMQKLEVWRGSPQGLLASLKLTLPHFVNLRDLRLDQADDEIFAIIGKSLPHLRSLMVYPSVENTALTDAGLAYLCVDDGVHGRCTLLQDVHLHKQCVSVTAAGVLLLLENLPHIKKVMHITSLEGLIMFVKKHHPAQLNIATKFYVEASQLSRINNSDLDLLLTYQPKIYKIKLNGAINLESLFEISDTDLLVTLTAPSFTLTNQLLFHLGRNIVELTIKGNSEVDISIIAKHCKQLDQLCWESLSPASFMYSFENTFENLSAVFIELDDIESKLFPLDALRAILSSECLIYVTISDIQLTDEFLLNVINLTKSNPEILSEIRTLVLRGIDGISFDVLQQFVCYTPALRSPKFYVKRCRNISDAQVEQLRDFIASLSAVDQVE